jgi:hypothetical protein
MSFDTTRRRSAGALPGGIILQRSPGSIKPLLADCHPPGGTRPRCRRCSRQPHNAVRLTEDDMRKIIIAAVSLAALAGLPIVASAQETVTGAAGGAAAGAVVGGPVGAVVGGVIGGTVGAASEQSRRDAEGRVIVEEQAPPVVVEQAPTVRERTCVDDGVSKTCTETTR